MSDRRRGVSSNTNITRGEPESAELSSSAYFTVILWRCCTLKSISVAQQTRAHDDTNSSGNGYQLARQRDHVRVNRKQQFFASALREKHRGTLSNYGITLYGTVAPWSVVPN